MVNIIVINERSATKAKIQRIKEIFDTVFKFVKEVNVHVLLNLKSPIATLGFYDYLFFIEVPYRKGNYFRTQSKIYLNNIVFAIRKVTDASIVDIKDGKMYTTLGEFNYNKLIDEETMALKQFIYDNIPNNSVKYANLALYYSLDAPNCPLKGVFGNLLCNIPIEMSELIPKTIDRLNKGEKGTTCLKLGKDTNLSNVISQFIEKAEAKTNQGILTKKKIDAISTKEIGKQMKALYNAAGSKLVIVRGKAGTGKSLALLRFMFNHVQSHHCRLLTYNTLLVMDMKMSLHNIGSFTPTNASIKTLHKFFYDIYIHTPVHLLHMDETQVNRLFALCHRRVSFMVVLIKKYVEEMGNFPDPRNILKHYKEKGWINEGDIKEMHSFAKYLSEQEDYSLDNLYNLVQTYENNKRMRFCQLYSNKAYLSGYRIIMEQLYLLFHNKEDFLKKFGEYLSNTPMSIRESGIFKQKYTKLYDEFIKECKKKFTEEYGIPEYLFTQYFVDEERLINRLRNEDVSLRLKKQYEDTQDQIKTIKRKVYWSQFVLIDEAQDCANYEKELLLELFGSANTIIATGGKDQLIRTAVETRWDVSFGNRLDSEEINLTHVSHRQKGNIVEFINAFAKDFGLNTKLNVPDSIKDSGRVIIDLRRGVTYQSMPIDVINKLNMYGLTNGCSLYESLMILFPNEGFTNIQDIGDTVTIDKNDTIDFGEERTRILKASLPESISPLDCTISDKAKLLEKVGQDKTRCLLYESCRGLEAWSVLCLGLDTFFAEKQNSHAATDYADEALGLFKDNPEQRKAQYEKFAALWLLMAFTRAVDTLYIVFAFPDSSFASRIKNIGANLPFVEILQ